MKVRELQRRSGIPCWLSLWAWKHNPNGAFVNWDPNVNCEPFNGTDNY